VAPLDYISIQAKIDSMENLPISDLKVLDLSQHVSGPYCTKLLADFGADVIKIENPHGGDTSRCYGPYPEDIPDREKSGLFLYLNTNKKSITLDLGTETGTLILEQLVPQMDILVENLGPGSIDYQKLQALNPSLIIASISYFGQDGPFRDYQGSDIVAQALGGMMTLTGLSDREPLKLAGPQAEYQAGINAAIAIMTALHFRDETGLGQHIDISVMECLASILEGSLLSQNYDGTVRERDGARHPTMYPSTILPCKDGYIHVDASTDWETFATFAQIPELLEFKPEDLREKANEIDTLLTRWLAQYTMEEIFHKAQEWRLPFAMVLGADNLSNDPQMIARDYFIDIEHPVTGQLSYPGSPFKMSRCQPKTGRAPLLGEQNQEIYCDLLGYSFLDLTKLSAMGVV
jgi:CoA:oxalate CoA-transferase